LQAPTKAGYTFNGWANSGTIPAGSSGNKTFTASWSPIDYTITYDLDGGTNSSSNPASYTIEDSLITLQAPTKAGYTFNGWSNSGTIETGSTGNKNFTASWSIASYTITYDLDGGTNSSSNPALYTIENPKITLQAPTKAGYTFNGWSNSGTIETGSTGNKTFTASWALASYTITYDLDGETNDPSNPTEYNIESSDITLLPPTTAKVGYIFDSWLPTDTIETGSTGNKTFTASWTPITYTITYDLDGGTNNSSNPTSYKITDHTIVLQDPTKEGYTFTGWTSGSKEISVIPEKSTGNMTLVANWVKTEYTMTLRTDENGSATALSPTTLLPNESFTFKVTPNEFYKLSQIMTSNGSTPKDNGDGTYTIEKVTSNCYIDIYFKKATATKVTFDKPNCITTMRPNVIASISDIFKYTTLPVGCLDTYPGWESSNPNVMEVSDGMVMAKNPGVSIVRIYMYNDHSVYDEILMTVAEPTTHTGTIPYGNITGKLLKTVNTPLAGYPVTLCSDPITVMTGADGSFTFPNVPLTNHELIVNDSTMHEIGRFSMSFNKAPTTSSTVDNTVKQIQVGYTPNTQTIDVLLKTDGVHGHLDAGDITYTLAPPPPKPTPDPKAKVKNPCTGYYD
jgi:uncharacterized repeat protein (TIGR02543 family)